MRSFGHGIPASGGAAAKETQGERRFRRFALWAAAAVLLTLVAVGTVFAIRARSSLRGQVERMELDVSRGLEFLLRSGEDVSAPIDALDATATRWRERLKSWKDVPFVEAEKMLSLQRFQDRTIPQWRAELASANSPKVQRENILRDVLREQSAWPPPPPPPIVWEFSNGVKDFANGALEGVVWPWLVGSRVAQVLRGSGCVAFGPAARFALFPHKAIGVTFGGILGFGVFAVVVGYVLCYAGMRANAALLSLLGLLYFLYAVVYALFIALLLLGLLE